MGTFNEFLFNEDTFGELDPDTWPVPGRERVPWTFFDGVDTYKMLVNPSEATMPLKQRRVAHRATTAGVVVAFEGVPEVPTMELSGSITSEAQFRALNLWVAKRKQIKITDDLQQDYWVCLLNFSPRRKKSAGLPWLMDYVLSGALLDRG